MLESPEKQEWSVDDTNGEMKKIQALYVETREVLGGLEE